MFDTDKPQERGQVGIGTLIVFIALVLVAAIAAGVLINTAGFLQTQAEQTGEQSTDQVANNLNIITATGEVAASGDEVDEVTLGVQPAAGADDINLAELTIQAVGNESFDTLTSALDAEDTPDDSSASAGDGEYAVDVITAENDDDIVMTDSTDRYQIIIDFSGSGDKLQAIQEGDEVELSITTGDGSQTTELIQVPDSLAGEDGGSNVTL